MAEASISVDQDQFVCPVCLDLLKDPVTIHCGHSFCKVCINGHWDQKDQKGVYSCPQCRDTLSPRPVLRRNNMLAEVVEKLKKKTDVESYRSKNELGAQTAVKDSEKIFTELISSMEKKRSEVMEMIKTQEEAELSRNKRLLEQLEQEITDLQRRVTELLHPDIHFLQVLASGRQSPTLYRPTFHTSRIIVSQHFTFEAVRNSVSDLKKRLEEFCEENFNKFPPQASAVQTIPPSEPQSREDFLTYFCYLTLDPITAHRNLILSEKNRAVRYSEREQQYSDHPERFDSWEQVLCEESVCGRCYWEVEWRSSGVVAISVSYKDISRKGRGEGCGFGRNNQSWSLRCSTSSYCFGHNNIESVLGVPSPSRIGVYVDHGAGTLSFYSVSDSMKLLHRVNTTFTQPLYAGFGLFCLVGSTSVRLCDSK